MRNLDKSISINGLTLKNRLVMPPMATSSANDGEVSQRILDYYDKKTKEHVCKIEEYLKK